MRFGRYLVFHNGGEIELLLSHLHKAGSQACGDIQVCRGQQAVRSEGLDYQQLVHRLGHWGCHKMGQTWVRDNTI